MKYISLDFVENLKDQKRDYALKIDTELIFPFYYGCTTKDFGYFCTYLLALKHSEKKIEEAIGPFRYEQKFHGTTDNYFITTINAILGIESFSLDKETSTDLLGHAYAVELITENVSLESLLKK